MRIFYAAPRTAHQTCLPDSNLWHVNLYLPLKDLGHELVVFDFDYAEFKHNLDHTVPGQRAFIDKNRPAFGSELLRQVRAANRDGKIDLFFSYFYAAFVEPDVIREIGSMGITTVNWYCNASYQFHLVEQIAPAYRYCLVPEKFRLADYRRVGATPLYCQEAANPNVYRPYDVPVEYDVTFVGQKYGTRPHLIRTLLDHGVDARVWGPHWQEVSSFGQRYRKLREALGRFRAGERPFLRKEVPAGRCGPPLADEELIKMYSRSKINLGFSAVAEAPSGGVPIKQVRLRDFEVTMSGGFYLVEYFEELLEFFEQDREIVCFADADELVDKARYYLRNAAQRERIRKAGYERCRREHTWHKRFAAAFREMGLD